MWKVLARARNRFASDQRGNVGILFGFAAIPVIGLLGGAVDVARHNRYETTLLNAMDSAAVALVRKGVDNDAEADAFVNNFVAGLVPWLKSDTMVNLPDLNAIEIEGGYRVEANGSMDTAFLPVVGMRTMPLDLATEVAMSGGNYEVALALDNTGSMDRYGRMEALRDAAGQLVDDLYSEEGTEDRVKMALVPFVTAVNIKTKGVIDERAWIEPTGFDQRIYGVNFSEPVNRLDLFRKDMRVEWGGCVEARQAPYDENDTPPTNAQTRWVPYLWPDEPDSGFDNSYLDDADGRDDWELLRNVDKYDVGPRKRVVNTTEKGPNAGCPRPIVELTNDKDRMREEIRLMKPHNETDEDNHTGTNVAQGLVWGWRVLSPEAPYEQGVSYEEETTTKVLVLLSDGRNQIVANDEVTQSDYTSYNYLAAGRLGSRNNYLVAERSVDAKVKRICQSIKDKNIRL